jgi:hypothetical protein
MIKKYVIGLIMTLTALNTTCMATPAEVLREQADVLREEGKTLEALNLYNQALVGFQQQHDYNGIFGVLKKKINQ